jgi:octaprenyl-diphosphate synthase
VTIIANLELKGAGPELPSLDALVNLVVDDIDAVNQVILGQMQSHVPLIPELAGYLIAAGGKRLRPMLTLASARMAGYEGDRHVKLAACVEFIHTATLLHDDVVDESDLRRGIASANAVWGNQASVLVGDFLFSRAFQLMVEDGALDVLRILSNASAVIAEGEVMQLVTSNNMQTGEAEYLQVIEAKTAALFEAACRVGAVVAEQTEAQVERHGAFGANLGIAFQLVDDVLDYSARQSTLGKTVGDDFREGKITLPVVLAYQRGSAKDRAFWHRCLEQGDQRDGDLKTAFALLEEHGALADTVDRARAYGKRACQALEGLPEGAYRLALKDTVEFCISRAF